MLQLNSEYSPAFTDFYRSLDISTTMFDSAIIDHCVRNGVVPDLIRYEIINRGSFDNCRGVIVKGAKYHYFNWATNANFVVRPADEDQEVEINNLLKNAKFGCDLRKNIIEPGTSVEEDTDEEDEKNMQAAGTSTVPEQRAIHEQTRAITDHHPGAAIAQTPDDPNVGRDWHKSWDRQGLLMAWADYLNKSAAEKYNHIDDDSLLAEYMEEQGVVKSGPINVRRFEHWKSDKLKKGISKLQDLIGKTQKK